MTQVIREVSEVPIITTISPVHPFSSREAFKFVWEEERLEGISSNLRRGRLKLGRNQNFVPWCMSDYSFDSNIVSQTREVVELKQGFTLKRKRVAEITLERIWEENKDMKIFTRNELLCFLWQVLPQQVGGKVFGPLAISEGAIGNSDNLFYVKDGDQDVNTGMFVVLISWWKSLYGDYFVGDVTPIEDRSILSYHSATGDSLNKAFIFTK